MQGTVNDMDGMQYSLPFSSMSLERAVQHVGDMLGRRTVCDMSTVQYALQYVVNGAPYSSLVSDISAQGPVEYVKDVGRVCKGVRETRVTDAMDRCHLVSEQPTEINASVVEKPYACVECAARFTHPSSLTRHKRIHTGECPHACERCYKTFKNADHLHRHERVHTGERPYACAQCDKRFTQLGNLRRHELMHTAGENYPFACTQCDKRFTKLRRLEAHELAHGGRHMCAKCEKRFVVMSELRRHELVHDDERPFVCTTCGKQFLRAYALERHESIHTGERPFACKQCDKQFIQKVHLQRHEKIHAGSPQGSVTQPQCSESLRPAFCKDESQNISNNGLSDPVYNNILSDISTNKHDSIVNTSQRNTNTLSDNSRRGNDEYKTNGMDSGTMNDPSSNNSESLVKVMIAKVSSMLNGLPDAGIREVLNDITAPGTTPLSNDDTIKGDPGTAAIVAKTSTSAESLDDRSIVSTADRAYLSLVECATVSLKRPRATSHDLINSRKKLCDRNKHTLERSEIVRPWRCTRCSKRFTRSSYLTRHQRAHDIDGSVNTSDIVNRNDLVQLNDRFSTNDNVDTTAAMTRVSREPFVKCLDLLNSNEVTVERVNVISFKSEDLQEGNNNEQDDDVESSEVYQVNDSRGVDTKEIEEENVLGDKQDKQSTEQSDCGGEYANRLRKRVQKRGEHKSVEDGGRRRCAKEGVEIKLASETDEYKYAKKGGEYKCTQNLREHRCIKEDKEHDKPISKLSELKYNVKVDSERKHSNESVEQKYAENRDIRKGEIKNGGHLRNEQNSTEKRTLRSRDVKNVRVKKICRKMKDEILRDVRSTMLSQQPGLLSLNDADDAEEGLFVERESYVIDPTNTSVPAEEVHIDRHTRARWSSKARRLKSYRDRYLTCKDCHQVFKQRKDLKAHIDLAVLHVTQFGCGICAGEMFNNEEDAKSCFYSHPCSTPPTPGSQSVGGGQGVGERENMTKPFFYHHKYVNNNSPEKTVPVDESPHECTQCFKRFITLSKLHRHKLVHAVARPYACAQCDKKFKQPLALRQHELIHAEKLDTVKPHECESCAMRFKFSSQLRLHRSVHTDERPFACAHCNKRYKLFKHLQTHEYSHGGKRPFACVQCKKRFAQSAELRRHERVHAGKSHVCRFCGKQISQLSNLIAHERIHTGELPYACTQCDRRFRHSMLLKQHVRLHTDQEFVCVQCGKRFKQLKHLRQHERIRSHTGRRRRLSERTSPVSTSGKNNVSTLSMLRPRQTRALTNKDPLICKTCGKQFNHLSTLTEHERIHTGERPFACAHCNKHFRQSVRLREHERTHTGNMYSCAVCAKQCTSKSNLLKHAVVHTGERPYACKQCDKRFSQTCNLRLHERIHSGELIACEQCGKRFTCTSRLRLHSIIHSGERPYGCKFCEKRFKFAADVRKHERIHTGERPYSCAQCDKRFTVSSNLRSHVRYNHRDLTHSNHGVNGL